MQVAHQMSENDRYLIEKKHFLKIEGWLTEEEGKALQIGARRSDCLEIGSYLGRSAVCMAPGCKSLICIDPFTGDLGGKEYTREGKYHYDTFLKNIAPWAHKITHYRVYSAFATQILQGKTFDLIFIDGNHTFAYVLEDGKIWRPFLRPGGVMAFHDYQMGEVAAGCTTAWGRGPDTIIENNLALFFQY